MIELKLVEGTVQKVNLQPGDTLFVTIKNDELIAADLRSIKESLQNLFPNNPVVVVGLDPSHSVEFTKISVSSEPTCVGCSSGQSHCCCEDLAEENGLNCVENTKTEKVED